jgi:hypothetical protein
MALLADAFKEVASTAVVYVAEAHAGKEGWGGGGGWSLSRRAGRSGGLAGDMLDAVPTCVCVAHAACTQPCALKAFVVDVSPYVSCSCELC